MKKCIRYEGYCLHCGYCDPQPATEDKTCKSCSNWNKWAYQDCLGSCKELSNHPLPQGEKPSGTNAFTMNSFNTTANFSCAMYKRKG